MSELKELTEQDVQEGIGELENYANQYIPENSRNFANRVERHATTTLPPAFDHAGLAYRSPLADDALDKVRSRLGDNASSATFVDLQQIISNEITDLEDQQTQFTGAPYERDAVTIRNYNYLENVVLKVLGDEEINSQQKRRLEWYLPHNIERWNRKGEQARNQGISEDQAIQNENIFSSLYEKVAHIYFVAPQTVEQS
jgi:hypothetical protein